MLLRRVGPHRTEQLVCKNSQGVTHTVLHSGNIDYVVISSCPMRNLSENDIKVVQRFGMRGGYPAELTLISSGNKVE